MKKIVLLVITSVLIYLVGWFMLASFVATWWSTASEVVELAHRDLREIALGPALDIARSITLLLIVLGVWVIAVGVVLKSVLTLIEQLIDDEDNEELDSKTETTG